jgi:hypothetical protein
MDRLLKPDLFPVGGFDLTRIEDSHFGWMITDDKEQKELIDTTIGKTPSEIFKMVTSRDLFTKRVLVPTEEEKQTWERVSQKHLVHIEYQVVDPSKDDVTNRHVYEDVFGSSITTSEEFDVAYDRWMLEHFY